MGSAIEKIALNKGHDILARIEENDWQNFDSLNANAIDVAIEFSQPEAAYYNIHKCLQRGIPVVSGTTGWLDQYQKIERFCKEKNGTFFYASNFSIGVNIFFKVNELIAKIMGNFPEYRIQMEETHHLHKKDSPSGTAITLMEGIFTHHGIVKESVESNEATKMGKEQLAIKSIRESEVFGTHAIQYNSAMDTISIEHKAHSREGFALGAVLVAEWIAGKKGVFNMQDFLQQ